MNVSEMTCSEVNEAIGALRGEWEIRTPDGITPFRENESPLLMKVYASRPNLKYRPERRSYTDDWAACGPCFEEMSEAVGLEEAVRRIGATLASRMREVIARVYLSWRQEEK